MAQLFKNENKQKLHLSAPSAFQILNALGNNAASNQKLIYFKINILEGKFHYLKSQTYSTEKYKTMGSFIFYSNRVKKFL